MHTALLSREAFNAESLHKDTLIAIEMGRTLGSPAFKDLKWLTGEESVIVKVVVAPTLQ
jgi:hypothetical protein